MGLGAPDGEADQLDVVAIGERVGDPADPGVVESFDPRCGDRRIADGHDAQRWQLRVAEGPGWILVGEAGQIGSMGGPHDLRQEEAGAEQRERRDRHQTPLEAHIPSVQSDPRCYRGA